MTADVCCWTYSDIKLNSGKIFRYLLICIRKSEDLSLQETLNDPNMIQTCWSFSQCRNPLSTPAVLPSIPPDTHHPLGSIKRFTPCSQFTQRDSYKQGERACLHSSIRHLLKSQGVGRREKLNWWLGLNRKETEMEKETPLHSCRMTHMKSGGSRGEWKRKKKMREKHGGSPVPRPQKDT